MTLLLMCISFQYNVHIWLVCGVSEFLSQYIERNVVCCKDYLHTAVNWTCDKCVLCHETNIFLWWFHVWAIPTQHFGSLIMKFVHCFNIAAEVSHTHSTHHTSNHNHNSPTKFHSHNVYANYDRFQLIQP